MYLYTYTLYSCGLDPYDIIFYKLRRMKNLWADLDELMYNSNCPYIRICNVGLFVVVRGGAILKKWIKCRLKYVGY